MKEKTNLPLISIVVPVYNGEKYIEDCIKSLSRQDYENIEIIVVNDGSKDKSSEIVEKLSKKDKRIKLINQKNSGVSAARNNGIESSNGKYITFVDVDDYVESDYISYYYRLLSENDVEVALTPFPRKFTEETKNEKIVQKEDKVNVVTGEEAAIQMLYYNIVISSWNKIYSSKLIEQNDIKFNTNLSFGEGFNFAVECFQRAKKVAIGNRKVYNYRVDNPNSVMTKISKKLVTGSIDAQDAIEQNLIFDDKRIKQACKYARWHTYCDCYNTIVGSEKIKEYYEEYKLLKKVCKREGLRMINAPISVKDKIKGCMYFVSPLVTAKIINHFRIRKFNKTSN